MSALNPTGGTVPFIQELNQLNQVVDPPLPRPLSIVSLYQSWNTAPTPGEQAQNLNDTVLSSQLEQISASGAIPLVNWAGGDPSGCSFGRKDVPLDQAIQFGAYDADYLVPYAQRLAALRIPILLRWFPDANDSLTQSEGGTGTPLYPDPGNLLSVTAGCLGSSGAKGYTNAFRHIVDVFRSNGATNVSFVWSVDTNNFDASDIQGSVKTWKSFYPGDGYVDWIGADDFVPAAPDTVTPSATGNLPTWYSSFAGKGKPLAVFGGAVNNKNLT
jgi:Glycosyl hydrolase family 26